MTYERNARLSRRTALIVVVLAIAVFWRTAYPTITWWDSSHYSLAASTLGVSTPPGSLLLTLLGWPVAHLPFGLSPAYMLNLFAGVLAALAAAMVYVVALRVLRYIHQSDSAPNRTAAAGVGAALGALTFAFSDTLWDHAIRFTPYVLTAVFTGLILWTLVRWWGDADRPESWRWLLLLGVLFGLDFGVHRTNALLMPGALVWILVRNPRVLLQPRTVVGGTGGVVAGLTVQLLIMPIAAITRSPINFTQPNTLTRFWDYVSLEHLGGDFLVRFFPRNADFWSVQVADFVRVMSANFFQWADALGFAGGAAALPALLALIGLGAVWRREPRMAVALALLVFLHASMTVLYFNIPAEYFRSMDRHYLPVCVTIAVLVACGLGAVMQSAAAVFAARPRVVAAFATGVALFVPAAQLAANWTARDASSRYFTRDYAANALEGLPRNAIYITVGDNDTFPLMYLQSVEGVRPDVRIINKSMTYGRQYTQQLLRQDSSFPVSVPTEHAMAISDQPPSDTTVILPVEGTAGQLGIADSAATLASLSLRLTGRERMLAGDVVLLSIVRTNRWRRPITFALTGSKAGMGWLGPYGRLDGLYYRVVPVANPRSDIRLLRSNLLSNEYRGYADTSVRIDDDTRIFGFHYYNAFTALLEAERAGEPCREVASTISAMLPPARLNMPDGTPACAGRAVCGSSESGAVCSRNKCAATTPSRVLS